VALSEAGKGACPVAVAQPSAPPSEAAHSPPPVVPDQLELAPSSDSLAAPPHPCP
jgi:hypothetical protein